MSHEETPAIMVPQVNALKEHEHVSMLFTFFLSNPHPHFLSHAAHGPKREQLRGNNVVALS